VEGRDEAHNTTYVIASFSFVREPFPLDVQIYDDR
jgi:hypothetical protein